MPHNDAKLTKPTIIGYLEECKTPCIAFILLFRFLARHGQQLGIRTTAKRFRSDLRHELEIRLDQAFSVALEEIEGISYSLDGNGTSETWIPVVRHAQFLRNCSLDVELLHGLAYIVRYHGSNGIDGELFAVRVFHVVMSGNPTPFDKKMALVAS